MNENILIFDTETIGLEKAFCYNIGWIITNKKTKETIVKRDFVVKQIWENKPLFETAYYNNKKQLYINALRGRKAIIRHYGFIMQTMIRDIENYKIETVFAFNSPFDIKVLDFNCNWFKCSNALDYVKTIDIRSLVNPIIFNEDYKQFCKKNNLITPSNNLEVNAESIYKYISNNPNFQEEHTALSDSIIEKDILMFLLDNGINIEEEKKVYNIINSDLEQEMIINHKEKEYRFQYKIKRTNKGVIYLK